MARTLTLELDDQTYERLEGYAARQGQAPAETARDAVLRLVTDPLDEVVGLFSSGQPGWSDRHDEYLGQALFEQAGFIRRPR